LNRCERIGNEQFQISNDEPVTPIENPKSQIVNSGGAGVVAGGPALNRCEINLNSEIANLKSAEAREALPLSLLNDYLYCRRRAALKIVEGWREANEHTARGEIVHEHTDLAGYESLRESEISNLKSRIILWRALPVWSDRLGLSGKCDIVEAEFLSASNLKSQISDLKSGRVAALRPVEFKVGKRRQWENDDAQLCAQALCLEEMFNVAIPRGAVFHADSKRRRQVEFTAALRGKTVTAARELHALLAQSEISDLKSQIAPLPPAVFKPACEECSLYEICLPKATAGDQRAQRLARLLFQI
jgi:CRISPR-associated exonuclease Cas4